MPRLSIVIPVLGDPQQLDDTLLSVLENRPANCEIVVVHNQPYHDPYNLSDEVRFVAAAHGAGLVACINEGIAASRSPIVHVLACPVEVCPGWADAALRHFGNPDVAAVAAVVLDRNGDGKIVSAGWGYRAEGTPWRLGRQIEVSELATYRPDLCGPDLMAAFYRMSAIESVGGFSPRAGDALAAIDLALALRHAGGRCVLEPQCAAHVDAEAVRTEWAFRRGRHAERLFWRWASSHGWLRSLAGHAALLAGQCVIGLYRPALLVELAGRFFGMLQAALASQHPRPSRPNAVEEPSVLAAPQFATSHLRDEQPSTRAA